MFSAAAGTNVDLISLEPVFIGTLTLTTSFPLTALFETTTPSGPVTVIVPAQFGT